ncbi:MAG: transglutaminase-like domain-containing protein [Candidatus Omnitrophota bacterium]|nr:transglutaminase-like domain-containing protein [Candidatus Omnitrophota bacterium]
MRTHGIAWIVGMGLLGMPLSVAAEQAAPPPSQPTRLASAAGMAPAVGATSVPLIDQIASSHRTPSAIAAFLRDSFTFQRDEDLFGEVDRWQSPEEFLQRRTGDCEDYALLAQALLERNGVEGYVFSLFGEEGYAHTVSVYRDEDGRYNVINEDKLRRYRAKSLEAVAAQLNPAWTYAIIAERHGTRGRTVRELINEHPVSWTDEPPTVEF